MSVATASPAAGVAWPTDACTIAGGVFVIEGKSAMTKLEQASLALCILLAGAFTTGTAQAQADKTDKPVDYKQFIVPVLPPLQAFPNSQLNPGIVGGSSDPYTTAPLQGPPPASVAPAPGLKLTVPSR
jgi:hypothetical protein